jgi:putative methyltransferase (TIGR04325 family)
VPGRLELVSGNVSRAIGHIPPLSALRERYQERLFLRRPGTFRGIYGSFAEATREAPKNAKLGYDHAELADLYTERHTRVLPSDYPAMFWLDRIFRSATSLFDFGGHLGVQFYSYAKYLNYPQSLRWTVLDMPAIVDRGRKLAAERGRAELSFTTDLARAADHDVFFASGSLQYVETPFAEMLAGLSRLPRHLLINKLPLHDGSPYVTLQNVQFTFSPYAISNRTGFIASLTNLGYELVDAWENPDLSCILPLHPDLSVRAYSGLYLRRAAG